MLIRSLRLAALAAALALLTASDAFAATVHTQYTCYTQRSGAQFRLSGGGFAPASTVRVSIGTRSLGNTTARADGTINGRFGLPPVPKGRFERAYTVTATDGANTTKATLRVTRFTLTLSPSSGRPDRAVRLGLYGWFGKTVYLHYVQPGDHTAFRTVRLGRTRGACGHGSVRLAHLYPVRRPRAGSWRLQFDTHRAYARRRAPSIVINGRVTYGH